VRLTTHNGTHLDAPYHYSATMDGGRAMTIDVPRGHAPVKRADRRRPNPGRPIGAR
jgi:kynurenine formamidase